LYLTIPEISEVRSKSASLIYGISHYIFSLFPSPLPSP
jgi:hypothetical protein